MVCQPVGENIEIYVDNNFATTNPELTNIQLQHSGIRRRWFMELFKGKYLKVVFVNFCCQNFPGNCIISCKRESLSKLTK